ncbi:uncharacterized protein LOC106666640 [Cimex lectularius]|uniref:Protein kinase domain-containing protein n=1 Tax=Cimex lectularius TaxID=79782 RepID=A0A8I6THI7_CIMLE|nr:uncharacterized protein LOC106666640 [Cimex lectularius]
MSSNKGTHRHFVNTKNIQYRRSNENSQGGEKGGHITSYRKDYDKGNKDQRHIHPLVPNKEDYDGQKKMVFIGKLHLLNKYHLVEATREPSNRFPKMSIKCDKPIKQARGGRNVSKEKDSKEKSPDVNTSPNSRPPVVNESNQTEQLSDVTSKKNPQETDHVPIPEKTPQKKDNGETSEAVATNLHNNVNVSNEETPCSSGLQAVPKKSNDQANPEQATEKKYENGNESPKRVTYLKNKKLPQPKFLPTGSLNLPGYGKCKIKRCPTPIPMDVIPLSGLADEAYKPMTLRKSQMKNTDSFGVQGNSPSLSPPTVASNAHSSFVHSYCRFKNPSFIASKKYKIPSEVLEPLCHSKLKFLKDEDSISPVVKPFPNTNTRNPDDIAKEMDSLPKEMLKESCNSKIAFMVNINNSVEAPPIPHLNENVNPSSRRETFYTLNATLKSVNTMTPLRSADIVNNIIKSLSHTNVMYSKVLPSKNDITMMETKLQRQCDYLGKTVTKDNGTEDVLNNCRTNEAMGTQHVCCEQHGAGIKKTIEPKINPFQPNTAAANNILEALLKTNITSDNKKPNLTSSKSDSSLPKLRDYYESESPTKALNIQKVESRCLLNNCGPKTCCSHNPLEEPSAIFYDLYQGAYKRSPEASVIEFSQMPVKSPNLKPNPPLENVIPIQELQNSGRVFDTFPSTSSNHNFLQWPNVGHCAVPSWIPFRMSPANVTDDPAVNCPTSSNQRSVSETYVNKEHMLLLSALGPYVDQEAIQGNAVLGPHGFYLGKIIGRGAFSIVRVAVSKKHNFQRVAVKIIAKFQAPDELIKKFLPREICVVKALTHKNIIRFLATIESTHRVYLVMELAEAGNLLQFLRRHGRVTELRAKAWFQELTSAVHYCHQNGVVHRDIKCENILFDLTGCVKLSDFGFAKTGIFEVNGIAPTSHTFCGSYAYASPEILRLSTYQPLLADVWSMGVVLWAMVYGKLPFDSSSYSKLLKQVETPIVFPQTPSISKELQSLVKQIFVPEATRLNIQGVASDPWLVNLKVETKVVENTASPLQTKLPTASDKPKPANSGQMPAQSPSRKVISPVKELPPVSNAKRVVVSRKISTENNNKSVPIHHTKIIGSKPASNVKKVCLGRVNGRPVLANVPSDHNSSVSSALNSEGTEISLDSFPSVILANGANYSPFPTPMRFVTGRKHKSVPTRIKSPKPGCSFNKVFMSKSPTAKASTKYKQYPSSPLMPIEPVAPTVTESIKAGKKMYSRDPSQSPTSSPTAKFTGYPADVAELKPSSRGSQKKNRPKKDARSPLVHIPYPVIIPEQKIAKKASKQTLPVVKVPKGLAKKSCRRSVSPARGKSTGENALNKPDIAVRPVNEGPNQVALHKESKFIAIPSYHRHWYKIKAPVNQALLHQPNQADLSEQTGQLDLGVCVRTLLPHLVKPKV